MFPSILCYMRHMSDKSIVMNTCFKYFIFDSYDVPSTFSVFNVTLN